MKLVLENSDYADGRAGGRAGGGVRRLEYITEGK